MKILTIVHNTVCSGASKSLMNLVLGLKKKNVEIEFVVPNNGHLCRELEEADIKYHIVPFTYSAYPNLNSIYDYLKFIPRLLWCILKNLKATYLIDKIIKKYQPDIIHSNVSVIDVGYFAAKLNRLPHVWHIREYGDIDFNINSFPSKKIKKNRLNKNSYTISITKDIARYFKLGTNNRTIYNGIVSDEPVPINLKKEKIFLYVGWITDNKGVPLIIGSFIKFHQQHPDYKLYLIGEGDPKYISNIKSLISENNLLESIIFLGYKNNVSVYMQSATALIVASKKEGFGRITAEAMANGCLVIGMNTGGTKEQFDNGKEIAGREIGLRYNNKLDLLEAMRQVDIMNKSLYNQIISDAQSVVHRLYSKNSNVDITYNFFLEILKPK